MISAYPSGDREIFAQRRDYLRRNVRFGALSGLKSDISQSPKRANKRHWPGCSRPLSAHVYDGYRDGRSTIPAVMGKSQGLYRAPPGASGSRDATQFSQSELVRYPPLVRQSVP